MKRKIVVDARMINMSGIGTYIKNNMREGLYETALGNVDEIHRINPQIDVVDYNEKIYGIKEQFKFPYKKVKRQRPDILHVPHYNVPIFYRGKMVVTIHDLIHLVYPQYLPNKFAYIYARMMIGIAIKKAKVVITDSENTKKDIIKFYRNVNPEKIKVFYLGISSEYHNKSLEQIEYLYDKFVIPRNKKLIMYVGNMKPHKNLERLIQAFSQIKNIDDARLILVGKAFDNYDLNEIEVKNNVKDKVIHTGLVKDQEIVDFYNLVDVFVFPSLYEGYGLPPLEAMACGTPVISSNTSSMTEVLGDAALYIDPLNVMEMTNAIDSQICIKKKDNELVKKGYEQVERIRKLSDIDKLIKLFDQI